VDLVLDTRSPAAQVVSQPAKPLVFAIQQLTVHAELGVLGVPVPMELEPELEPVQQVHHAQPFNQRHAVHGTAQQALTLTVLGVQQVLNLQILVDLVLDTRSPAAQVVTQLAKLLVFATQHKAIHVELGVLIVLVLEELKLELEPVQQVHHAQHPNLGHAPALGTVQQAYLANADALIAPAQQM
jgi:hypothetical protein